MWPGNAYAGIAIQAALNFKHGNFENPYNQDKEKGLHGIYEVRFQDAKDGKIKIIEE